MLQATNTSYCTTNHNCPALRRILTVKIDFVGYVPKGCREELANPQKLVFFVQKRNDPSGRPGSQRFLVTGNTVEEIAAELASAAL